MTPIAKTDLSRAQVIAHLEAMFREQRRLASKTKAQGRLLPSAIHAEHAVALEIALGMYLRSTAGETTK